MVAENFKLKATEHRTFGYLSYIYKHKLSVTCFTWLKKSCLNCAPKRSVVCLFVVCKLGDFFGWSSASPAYAIYYYKQMH